MRSPTERALWTFLAAALVVGAVAAWWTHDQWGPQAEPWAQQTWRKLIRPGTNTLPPDKQAAAQRSATGAQDGASASAVPPRKCMQGERTIYTDQPCPLGNQELPVDGAVTSLPSAQ